MTIDTAKLYRDDHARAARLLGMIERHLIDHQRTFVRDGSHDLTALTELGTVVLALESVEAILERALREEHTIHGGLT